MMHQLRNVHLMYMFWFSFKYNLDSSFQVWDHVDKYIILTCLRAKVILLNFCLMFVFFFFFFNFTRTYVSYLWNYLFCLMVLISEHARVPECWALAKAILNKKLQRYNHVERNLFCQGIFNLQLYYFPFRSPAIKLD